jgi:hypothetical protein
MKRTTSIKTIKPTKPQSTPQKLIPILNSMFKDKSVEEGKKKSPYQVLYDSAESILNNSEPLNGDLKDNSYFSMYIRFIVFF